MKTTLLRSVIKGVIAGAIVGLFFGLIYILLSTDYEIRWRSFTHLNLHEQAQFRITENIVLAFVAFYATLGPFAITNTLKVIRPTVYGFLTMLSILVGITLVSAWFRNEQPFNWYKTSESTSIDFVRSYGVPASVICGPILGVLVHRRWSRKGVAS